MIYALQDWFDEASAAQRRWVVAASVAAGLAVLIAALVATPRTPFGDATGFTNLQVRVQAAASAAYWAARAKLEAEEVAKPVIVYGVLDRMDKKTKRLLADVPMGGKWVKASYQIADLQISNWEVAQSYLSRLPTKNVRLEVFYGTHVVAFVQDQPLNLGLISAGAASVNPNPPSNMVSKAYAAYYWSLVKGVNL